MIGSWPAIVDYASTNLAPSDQYLVAGAETVMIRIAADQRGDAESAVAAAALIRAGVPEVNMWAQEWYQAYFKSD